MRSAYGAVWSLLIAWGALAFASSVSAQPPKRPFDVRDSIQMTVLADPDAALASQLGAHVKPSPDGHWFLFVTRQGNINYDINESILWVLSAAEVRSSVAQGRVPVARRLATLASGTNEQGIAGSRWLSDSRTIAFLGTDRKHGTQVYRISIDGGQPVRLTDSKERVLDFDLSPSSKTFVYLALSPAQSAMERAKPYVVGARSIIEVEGGRERTPYPLARYYVQRGVTRQAVDLPEMSVYGDFRRIFLSPDGHRAIVVQHVAAPPISWWHDYQPVAQNPVFREAGSSRLASFLAPQPNALLQYMLIDLGSGRSKPAIAAPTGLLFGGIGLWAGWSSDGKGIILANTFLPLDNIEPAERKLRAASPSVVEITTATGKIHKIADLIPALPNPPRRGRFNSASLDADGTLCLEQIGAAPSCYARNGESWREVPVLRATTSGLEVVVDQSVDRAPELMARDSASGRSRIITDLNPSFRSIAWARTEAFAWTDRTGRSWNGGLMLPPGYEPGQRYPMVIQTHGFDPSSFLVDGPGGSSSGFAARALAARGMIVLQVQDSQGPLETPEEASNQVEGYRAAIDALAARGLIDRKHVGLHGWSRTGYYVQRAIVSEGLDLAAASVSDASELSPWTYANFFGAPYPGMLEIERMMGSTPWASETMAGWEANDPLRTLSTSRVPLHIETYGTGFAWWDIYGILRRHGRPAEYVSFPDGAHMLFKASERLISGEAAVDWFRFWLRGEEDRVPLKQDQYLRWQSLRDASDPEAPANNSTPRVPVP